MSTGGEIGEDRAYGRFGRISAAYDAARREFPNETVAYVIRHLAGNSPFVLDLACGTGISTRQLAAGGIEVVGCDVDPRMVRYATGHGGARACYVIGRAESIPFKDATFDAVACFRAYHWFDPARAVPEMMRVLRPDSRIAIANMTGGDGLYDDFRKLVARFVSGELPDHRKTYDPKRDLRAHGLRVIDEHTEREQQTATVADFCAQLQSISVWNLIPEGRLPAALDALNEFCQARANGGVVVRVLVYDTIIATR
jgi:ubiquinone/menaquinone biosynthesis C-methylase UbiE